MDSDDEDDSEEDDDECVLFFNSIIISQLYNVTCELFRPLYSDEDDESDGDVKPQKKMIRKVSQLYFCWEKNPFGSC